MNMEDFSKYFSGEYLYGDDFSHEEIAKWYEQESEAYANLAYSNTKMENLNPTYGYHHLNTLYGYKYLKKQDIFHNVLGLGSSWGYEFLPVIDRIQNLTILEPSLQTRSARLGNIIPKYQTPDVAGNIEYPDCSFDLITCFGTLHHIPNVSYVMKELFRVLQPGGYLLLREPVNSMGDWRNKRTGLTTCERGIPKDYFIEIIKSNGMEIVHKHYCFCMTSFFKRVFTKLNTASWLYLYIDKFLSRLLSFNIHYHPKNKFQRISPICVFYVLKKPLQE